MTETFSYNQNAPLNKEEAGRDYHSGTSVRDISYAGLKGERVRAYLVAPAGEGPFPGIIFVHPGPGNRSSFLDEAITLARTNAVCLLIDAPWAKGAEFGKRASGQPEDVRDWFIEIAIDLRRAVDLISSLPDVDKNRIAYVGHSMGALFGGILAGVDRRIKACVLIAGVGSFTDVAQLNMPSLAGSELERYKTIMEPIDPKGYIKNAAPSALFFQFGRTDSFFPRQKFLDYYGAASEPKSIQWYDADHYSLNEVGRPDRIKWLAECFQL
ncbi:MAG: alpha/beta fold hydrolase [Methanothrix sp.]|nr:alpha/beta fold hydrolase [Methanothrix sp.]MDD4447502.1 alpha/beta fold hydrolase [Methanothrix sp.]